MEGFFFKLMFIYIQLTACKKEMILLTEKVINEILLLFVFWDLVREFFSYFTMRSDRCHAYNGGILLFLGSSNDLHFFFFFVLKLSISINILIWLKGIVSIYNLPRLIIIVLDLQLYSFFDSLARNHTSRPIYI